MADVMSGAVVGGIVAVGIATAIGVVLGALAGYYRGWVDVVIMRTLLASTDNVAIYAAAARLL